MKFPPPALPPFHLGWFLAAINLALWACAFADKEPWPPEAIAAIHTNPPAWDMPVFIAARSLQPPPLESPLTGVLQVLNIPALIVSFPFLFVAFRYFPPTAQHSLSYIYAAVFAWLMVLQWLFVGRLSTWLLRKARSTFHRAA